MSLFLPDKSALVHLHRPEAEWLRTEVLAGRACRCSMTDLEVAFSARNAEDLRSTRDDRAAGFRLVDTTQADWDRALDVMTMLARRGQHRHVGIPDLLIAAIGERHELVVVHYDRDFDAVSAVTGQPTRWVAPAGTWT